MNDARAGAPRSPAGWWPELLVITLAAVVRFWRLGYHSIWFDEAVSLKWARSDAGYIWRMTFALVEEKHPPAYYLLLHGWEGLLSLLGLERNEIWLRASGGALGVLTVVGLLLLTRRLSGRAVSLAAALAAALAPALVWYSQELRMFQPAATALVWGALCLLLAWESRSAPRRLGLWAAMAICFLFALYAYLFSALALPAAGLSLLLLWAAARKAPGSSRRLLEGIAAFAVITGLYLPLALNALAVNSAENSGSAPFANFPATAERLLRSWTIWRPGWPAWLEATLLVLVALLLLGGLLLPRRTIARTQWLSALPPWMDRAWLALWVGVPVLVGNLLLAGNASVFGEDRYFLFVAPFALWAVARGAVVTGEWVAARATRRGAGEGRRGLLLRIAPALVVALILLAALPVLWTPARYREQWRAAIGWIEAQVEASPGLRSAIITHVDYTRLPAEWYLRQNFSFDELPLYFPFGGRLSADQVESVIAPPLRGVETEGFDTLYLLQSHLDGVDDERLVEGWLTEHYPAFAEAYPPGIKLTAYTMRSRYPELPALNDAAATPNALLAPGLRLSACELLAPQVALNDPALHPGPGWATVRLWWQRDEASGPPATGWRSRVRLTDGSGVWGERVASTGSLWERLPPDEWERGEFLREEVAVALNPATRPGTLEVEVRLVDGAGNEGASTALCGELLVQ
jgi:hypothetical protein